MFTGIIKATGLITTVETVGSNTRFWVESPLSDRLKPDQSVSHDGVCLTVEEVRENQHRVTAIAETLKKTTLGDWQPGHPVNLETCLQLQDPLDGHIVQGHVDCTATCSRVREKDGSWEYRFTFPKTFAALVIEKGSIAVNGISLTAFNVKKNSFTVAIIPYTHAHTNIGQLRPGSRVNIEFDILGKYLLRKLSLDSRSRKRDK